MRNVLAQLDPGDPGMRILNVNEEGSVPTWLSSALLLLCSLLALSTPKGAVKDHAVRYAGRWKVLVVLLLLMSLDEGIGLHETTIEPLRSALNAGGPFYFAWVIPGIIFVVAFALAYFRFLLDLPTKTRRLFAVAGTLYVGGSLIMEMIGGSYADSYGEASIAYLIITSVEEYLEMLGAATLLYALMLCTRAP